MDFIVKDRIIETASKEKIISYNKDYIARFSFDEEWDGTIKTARFIQNGKHEDKALVNDQCEMPSLKKGLVRIGVFNATMTSTYEMLEVDYSIKDDSGNPVEPGPDVYAQLISLIQSGMLKGKDGYTPIKGKDYFTLAEVEEIIGEADVFSQKAGESATAAAKSEQNATLSERNALSSEQSAKKSEENASKSEQAAEQSASNASASATAAKKSETAVDTSAKSAADSASAAEKSKNDAQALVNRFGDTVSEATAGAVKTVNDTKDAGINEINNLMATIPEDYTAMAADVNELKSDLINVNQTKADKTALASTNRRVDAIYKITEGQSWQEETVDTESYSNDVPTGSVLAKLKKIGGKSIVWNQLANANVVSSGSVNGLTYSSDGNGKVHLSSSGTTSIVNIPFGSVGRVVNGHKYLATLGNFYTGKGGDLLMFNDWNGYFEIGEIRTSSFETVDSGKLKIRLESGTSIDGDFYPQIFDLTAWFGAGNEPSTVEGAYQRGVPREYVPYCEPTIISSQTDRVDVVGKNLCNGSTEYANGWYNDNGVFTDSNTTGHSTSKVKCNPSTQYCLSGNKYNANQGKYCVFNIYMWDSNDNFIGRVGNITDDPKVFTTDSKCAYITFQIDIETYYNLAYIQIELGSTESEYKPYIGKSIETGFPALNSAGSVYDYIDLNEGKLHRRVGVVDLGTLDWTYNATNTYFQSGAIIGLVKEPSGVEEVVNGICNKLSVLSYQQSFAGKTDNSLCVIFKESGLHGNIWVTSLSCTDAAAFKAAMSGTMLYYELAEEIITDIEIPAELADCLVVEAGGSITFHNSDEGKQLLIPNTTTYVEKLSEVTNG